MQQARGYPVADACSYLVGAWEIDRRIVDPAASLVGRFTGAGSFRPHGGGLRYAESGWLRTGTYTCRAGRSFVLWPGENGRAEVAFSDGRPFHRLDLRSGCWHVAHPCGDDLYLGRFVVRSPSTWEVTWSMGGPATDAHSLTVYHRIRTDVSSGRLPASADLGRHFGGDQAQLVQVGEVEDLQVGGPRARLLPAPQPLDHLGGGPGRAVHAQLGQVPADG